MVKTTFNIRTDNFDNAPVQLFIEIAPQQVSALVRDNNDNFISFLAFALSDNTVNEVKEIVNNSFFSYPFQKVHIIWVQPQSIFTPAHLSNANNNAEMLSLVFGPGNDYIQKTDFLEKFDLYNAYRIPSALHNLIKEKFPDAQHHHQFSILPSINDKKGIALLCIFYNNGFTIQVKNKGEIIFTNYFNFMVPDDVVYYLLNICTTFDLPAEELQLTVAGLIEKESILYKELYKYFLNINFHAFLLKHSRNEALKNYPNHFFDHLFSVTTCV